MKAKGFTLIEVMIVVAIIAILAAVGLPAYSDYVTRAKLTSAYSALGAARVRMEQYFQDNRSWANLGATPGVPPTGCEPITFTADEQKYFSYKCSNQGATTYTITATGTDASVKGATFTIDQSNTKKTGTPPPGWTAPSGNCWVMRKNGSC